MTAPDLRYPIGFAELHPTPEQFPAHTRAIAALPGELGAAYSGLDDAQLLRQLAHHVADSHMQAFARLKFALTEDWPTIVPYEEKLWVQTGECAGPVDAPLLLLTGLHARWAALLGSLDAEQQQRGVVHPERGRLTVAQLASMYAWHGRHHTAHVTALRQRMGW
jgi:hypothetical protein